MTSKLCEGNKPSSTTNSTSTSSFNLSRRHAHKGRLAQRTGGSPQHHTGQQVYIADRYFPRPNVKAANSSVVLRSQSLFILNILRVSILLFSMHIYIVFCISICFVRREEFNILSAIIRIDSITIQYIL